jgi:hypothetical protein
VGPREQGVVPYSLGRSRYLRCRSGARCDRAEAAAIFAARPLRRSRRTREAARPARLPVRRPLDNSHLSSQELAQRQPSPRTPLGERARLREHPTTPRIHAQGVRDEQASGRPYNSRRLPWPVRTPFPISCGRAILQGDEKTLAESLRVPRYWKSREETRVVRYAGGVLTADEELDVEDVFIEHPPEVPPTGAVSTSRASTRRAAGRSPEALAYGRTKSG